MADTDALVEGDRSAERSRARMLVTKGGPVGSYGHGPMVRVLPNLTVGPAIVFKITQDSVAARTDVRPPRCFL